ncbi:hypothetical protein KY328_03190 [Candidatus Woesearchaeota archaeon]|nr:hypothetical protein [Candidatus Woesearchaeota archaeon]MBW3021898.1 hypothetical protein [Candidatus Woesearchaeota archaeon]
MKKIAIFVVVSLMLATGAFALCTDTDNSYGDMYPSLAYTGTCTDDNGVYTDFCYFSNGAWGVYEYYCSEQGTCLGSTWYNCGLVGESTCTQTNCGDTVQYPPSTPTYDTVTGITGIDEYLNVQDGCFYDPVFGDYSYRLVKFGMQKAKELGYTGAELGTIAWTLAQFPVTDPDLCSASGITGAVVGSSAGAGSLGSVTILLQIATLAGVIVLAGRVSKKKK